MRLSMSKDMPKESTTSTWPGVSNVPSPSNSHWLLDTRSAEMPTPDLPTPIVPPLAVRRRRVMSWLYDPMRIVAVCLSYGILPRSRGLFTWRVTRSVMATVPSGVTTAELAVASRRRSMRLSMYKSGVHNQRATSALLRVTTSKQPPELVPLNSSRGSFHHALKKPLRGTMPNFWSMFPTRSRSNCASTTVGLFPSHDGLWLLS
mmetsp:Transcript_19014/g.54209  ORF Transcript_19014/g.54209 Transcript_19014/m.54209 type:complete len:204 (+) Transcript_19014:1205-1816(+)